MTRLFQPLDAAIKHIYGLKITVPSELLHTPPKLGGLGIPNMVHLVHKHKLGMLCRASTYGNPAASSAKSIMDRAIRQQGLYDTSGVAVGFDNQYTHSWFGSILQLNELLSHTFTRKPDPDRPISVLSLCAPHHREWCIEMLACHDITDVLDITLPSTGAYRTWLPTHPVIPLLTHFPPVPSQSSLPLKVGRFYLTASELILPSFIGVYRGLLLRPNIYIPFFIKKADIEIAKPKKFIFLLILLLIIVIFLVSI
jgi:hypothetical protein